VLIMPPANAAFKVISVFAKRDGNVYVWLSNSADVEHQTERGIIEYEVDVFKRGSDEVFDRYYGDLAYTLAPGREAKLALTGYSEDCARCPADVYLRKVLKEYWIEDTSGKREKRRDYEDLSVWRIQLK